MTIEQAIKNGLIKTFEKLFDLDKFQFDKIIVKKEVIEDITILAKENHPNEFLAFLDGEIKHKKLIITGLLYQEYNANENSAAPIFRFPTNTFYGSVHSHPSYSNRPSSADRQFFRKVGIINLIICNPYNSDNIKFYNNEGEEINIEIE
jgi:proteasome lid subunit RPN8/RPN11